MRIFYLTLELSIDCETNVRELGELSGSSYVCRFRVTDRVYVVLCDTILRSATCNSRSTSPVGNIAGQHTMTADWTMYARIYIYIYTRQMRASIYMSSMRAWIISRNALAWLNCCYRKLISRHRDILSFERESARQRVRECWKVNLQD